MENNQQNFINQLNASWNAEPQTDKNIVSAAQGYQNNQNSENKGQKFSLASLAISYKKI